MTPWWGHLERTEPPEHHPIIGAREFSRAPNFFSKRVTIGLFESGMQSRRPTKTGSSARGAISASEDPSQEELARAPPFFGRYRWIPIADSAALVDRLRYLLAQGTKEGLVLDR